MDVLVLIGRILFVALFLSSGFAHLTQTRTYAGYAGSKGVPNPQAAVLGSGVLMVVGALMIAFGLWADLGALLLAVFIVPTAFLMHGFWRETDPMTRSQEQIQFLKDLALAGAALMLIGLFAEAEPGLMFTEPLFD